MEARVAHLEEDMKEIKGDLKALRTDMSDLKAGLLRLEGRLSAMPTTLHLIGFAVAIFVAAGVVRFFEPRVTAIQTIPPAVTSR